MKSSNENLLSSVKNALLILKCFTMDDPEKKVSDIANSLGLNKSTVSRTLATLASEGFVHKDLETRKYRLGLSILSLSGVVNSTMDIYKESQPVLNKLVLEIQETAHISVLDELDVIYLQKVECNHPVRALTHVGKRNPAYCTSSGKVLLAYGHSYIVDKIIENGIQRYTKNTIINPDVLYKELEEILKKGFAFSFEEFSEGVNSVAAPIYDYTGKVIASLTIVGPKQRIHQHNINSFAKKVINYAMEISKKLGYWK